MTFREQFVRAIPCGLALGIVVTSGYADQSYARSWVEGPVRYVEITHAGLDMSQGSQVGAAKCRAILGRDALFGQSGGQFSVAVHRQLSKTIGIRVRVSRMQRDTERLGPGRFRTRCNVADNDISASFKREPSKADIAEARLQVGVERIATGRHREGIDILAKLRDEANYPDALPAIVAGLISVDVGLALDTDDQYVRLGDADYRPALIEYRDALSRAGWAERARDAQRRLDELLR